jgi:galactosyl transferase GMA12/MNN10 family
MLANLALVPQNIMNSYHESLSKTANSVYKQGDFVITFGECDKPEQKCEENIRFYTTHMSPT